ncbi:MAG: hypothetical protein ACI9KE_001185 [Polyangiales bacterium]
MLELRIFIRIAVLVGAVLVGAVLVGAVLVGAVLVGVMALTKGDKVRPGSFT